MVINADDLGISAATNRAIAIAHRRGVVTSASLLANGPAFGHAVEHVVRSNPRLGVGIHLCLTSGESLLGAARVPLLADRRGRFRHGFAALWRLARRPPAGLLEQIEAELAAQFERLAGLGVALDHADGHRHVQAIPAVGAIAARLAAEFGCRALRRPHEPLRTRWPAPGRWPALARNLPKQAALAALVRRGAPAGPGRNLVGVLDSGAVTGPALRAAIAGAGPGVTEVITHPGGRRPAPHPALSRGDRRFLCSPDRRRELAALLDPELPALLRHHRVELGTFRDAIPVPLPAPPVPGG